MSTILSGARIWRSVFFLLVGAALGATLLGSGPGSATAVTTYTRSASCAGLDFYPTDSATEYENLGTLRTVTSFTGTGVFRCDPGLPTGAVVTKVQFTLYDYDNLVAVDTCNLVRSGLTVASGATPDTLASVPSTGVGPIPGIVRYTTTSIAFATIDNANYGYWLECRLVLSGGIGVATGIYGADVIYRITAAKG